MNSSLKNHQRGAVLVVGLVMLLLLTLIGMAAIRSSTMQERMAGNMRDHNLAFQSAEAGLSSAEAILNGVGGPPAPDAGVPGFGDTLIPYPGDAGYWNNDFDWGTYGKQTSMSLIGVHAEPTYYVEHVLTNAPTNTNSEEFAASQDDLPVTYRITSRAVGGSPDAVVILQATYIQ